MIYVNISSGLVDSDNSLKDSQAGEDRFPQADATRTRVLACAGVIALSTIPDRYKELLIV